ncbi:MAG TPA: hypothetical protein VML01_07140 [Bryobacterales bacterium]|nr:hypothetical protein [Bryobacterales bacterium]
MKPGTNNMMNGVLHEMKGRFHNPLERVPPPMVLMLLKAASAKSAQTSNGEVKELLKTLSKQAPRSGKRDRLN